jgi:hypothetical protein
MLSAGFFIFVLLAGGAVSQDNVHFPPDTVAPAPRSSRFLGTWVGQFQGEPYITVKLIEASGKISGTVVRNQVRRDRDGQIIQIEEQKSEGRVIDAKPNRDVLRFGVRDNASGMIERFEMTWKGSADAELVELSSGVRENPLVKPWKLTRISAE